MSAKRQAAALPHTGIATFCKAPYVFDPKEMDADVAVLGVPFDNMASMRPGCRQAPRALRDASTRFGWLGDPVGSSGYFDVGENVTFMSGVRMGDAGDVDVRLDASITRQQTTAHARSIVDRGLFLASIGGDHSISLPLVSAFEKFDPLTIVLLDAHLDYRDRSMDMKFSNNSPFRRIHELAFVKRIVTVGVRGIKSTDREYRESLDDGNLIFPMDRIYEGGIAAVVDEIGDLGNYYVSLDIDGLDPSIAPGTESPEADGLSFRQAKQLLRGVARRGKLVGTDIVEVNPYLDHAELTQHISVQLLLEAIASGFPSTALAPQ
ncbi:MAG: arginase family protein [Acidobacteriaceae bacterium]